MKKSLIFVYYSLIKPISSYFFMNDKIENGNGVILVDIRSIGVNEVIEQSVLTEM